MKKKLFLILLFGVTVGVFLLFKQVSPAHAAFATSSDPYGPVYNYSDDTKAFMTVSLYDSRFGSGSGKTPITGTIRIWTSVAAGDECADSHASTVDTGDRSTGGTNYISEPVSCYQGIYATGKSTNYNDFSYAFQDSSNGDCNILNWNGASIYYGLYLDYNQPDTGSITVDYGGCTTGSKIPQANLTWRAASGQNVLLINRDDKTAIPYDAVSGISSGQTSYTYKEKDGNGLAINTGYSFAIVNYGVAILRHTDGYITTPDQCAKPPQPVTKPDLRINYLRLYDSTGNTEKYTFSPGEAANMEVSVKNSGSADVTGNFSLYVWQNRQNAAACSSSSDWSYRMLTLTVGHTKGEGENFTVPTTPGTYYLRAFVDSRCEIDESNENNNQDYVTYTVSAPLLNLTADTAQINNGLSTFVRTSDPVPVSGIIKNIGVAKDLTNIGVGFYLYDGTIDQTQLRNYTRAATTTTDLTTNTTQSLVSSEVSVVGLTYGSHTLWICADYQQTIAETNETDNCATTTFTLAEPQDQWLQTQRGDVGARGNISLDYQPAGANNADYLVITQKTLVKNFTSAKNWLVKSYTPLNVYPTASSSYTSLLALYSKNGIPGVVTTENDVNNLAGNIGQTGPSSDMAIDSTPTSWPVVYAGGVKVIFVNRNLNINSNLQIASSTGLVFIVSGNITINSAVIQVDGVFISYGTFNTTSYNSCGIPLTETHSQLKINGAVYSFGQACFTRNLGKIHNSDPAELITYEPKYLVLFRELLGETVTSFKEVTP